jgi:hypothetical protein
MRTTTVMIRFIAFLAVLAGSATVAILVLPLSLYGSELTNRAQVAAAVSSGFALILSIMAIIVSARVSSSDFRAEEDVKAHTARLLATLRSMMAKGAVLSQMPPGAPLPLGFTHERTFLSDFLTSTTGFAYWSWAGNKSQAAKDKPEEWRVFFLNLINILGAEDANFRSMMRGAIVLETMVSGLSDDSPSLKEGASTVLHRGCVAPQPVRWLRSTPERWHALLRLPERAPRPRHVRAFTHGND